MRPQEVVQNMKQGQHKGDDLNNIIAYILSLKESD